MKKVIELIRVSTEGQAADDRAGIPAQRAINRRTATAYGLEIVRSIELSDVSGARVLAAPEIQELLRLIESPDIHGVVTKEFSRLMRPDNFSDYALLQVFVDTRTILYLPDGPVDLSSKTGSLVGVLRAAMAGMERREILERMNDGKEALRRAGRHAGGSCTLPFGVGYDRTSGKFFYTPEAEKIRQAYHLVLTSGAPYAEIARQLNLPRSSLRVILQNPIYSGVRIYDKKRDRSATGYIPGANGRQGYRRKVQREPEEIIQVRVIDQPLVPEATFHAVNQILSTRATRERFKRTQNAPRYIFNGFLRCGACQQPMYTRVDGTKTDGRWYYCKSNSTRARQGHGGKCETPHVLAKRIEPGIEELFARRLQNRNLLRKIAVKLAKQPCASTSEPDPAAISRQIEALTAKRTRILEGYFDGVIDRRTRDEQLMRVDADLSTYRAMLTKSAASPTHLDVAGLISLFSVFKELPFLRRDDKRALLRAAGAEVFVTGYKIQSIGLRAIPEPDSNTDSRLPAAGASLPARCVEIPAVRPETKRRYAKATLRRDAE